jgi:uncharacterized protein (DUF362 family)/Pyruvate/2-oxoacid:ferredoxin oxidoreductase delta subunit
MTHETGTVPETGTARVAVVRCDSYEPDVVQAAVDRGLELLGGAARFATAGERVLLKPNLLVASPADDAVTTHPEVFGAVARALKAVGADVSYGDSPGFGAAASVARRCGLDIAAEAEDVPLVEFDEPQKVPFPAGRLIKQFDIARAVMEADALVSLPKMKTHGLTRMTGAVKNQLGCVPGIRKGQWHACMPDAVRFSQMLVDLNRLLALRLVVMDAVVAMEGNGPRGGDPRQVGALLLSDDPVAVDATVCRMMALDSSLVLTVSFGESWGLGRATDIEYVGDPVDEFVLEDFVADRSPLSTTGGPSLLSRAMKQFVVPKPVILDDRCTSCGTCVSVCPVEPKAVQFASEEALLAELPPRYDYDACIRCYCCQEMCPEKAIEIERPLLGRLLERF